MSNFPTCATCGRSASDWIKANGTRWEPDLQEVRPSTWRCWGCRGEQHPDMPNGYLPSDFSQASE